MKQAWLVNRVLLTSAKPIKGRDIEEKCVVDVKSLLGNLLSEILRRAACGVIVGKFSSVSRPRKLIAIVTIIVSIIERVYI